MTTPQKSQRIFDPYTATSYSCKGNRRNTKEENYLHKVTLHKSVIYKMGMHMLGGQRTDHGPTGGCLATTGEREMQKERMLFT